MKRNVARKMYDDRYISQSNYDYGRWNEEQIPETYSHYADIAMETLLQNLQPKMEEETGLKLTPTYSYARIYKKGDILHRHKDRYSCEVSTTLNLGGDDWPIYLEPSGEEGKEGIKVDMQPGDMLVYKGCDVEHWREEFTGENCGQVFLHYNDASDPKAEENKYDKRPFLGLPSWFKS
tara:strand:- start:233 stop:766 length:534 start_codon:yes stop_codon:yes gene_type:complete